MKETLFISTAEAAQLLGWGINKTKYFARHRINGFPALKDGGRYFINRKLLTEWASKITVDGLSLEVKDA